MTADSYRALHRQTRQAEESTLAVVVRVVSALLILAGPLGAVAGGLGAAGSLAAGIGASVAGYIGEIFMLILVQFGSNQ